MKKPIKSELETTKKDYKDLENHYVEVLQNAPKNEVLLFF